MTGIAAPGAGARRGRLQSAPRTADGRAEDSEFRRANELMLRTLPIGTCLIDRAYRIISMNGTARRLLGVRDTVTDQDFLHTVRGIHTGTCARRSTGPSGSDRWPCSPSSSWRRAWVKPASSRSRSSVRRLIRGRPDHIENVTELVQVQRRLQAVQAEQAALADDLGTANQRLIEMNKDLQDANEELQAANEEMMLAQEELQATNEEFEATNEELQATNEELETNNEELQATNEELETTNEELQARTSELQEMTHILTGERTRLSEIVEQAPFHILVLQGPALVIESMNPPLGALFSLPASRRPFEEVCTDPALEPVRLACGAPSSKDGPGTARRSRSAAGMPSAISSSPPCRRIAPTGWWTAWSSTWRMSRSATRRGSANHPGPHARDGVRDGGQRPNTRTFITRPLRPSTRAPRARSRGSPPRFDLIRGVGRDVLQRRDAQPEQVHAGDLALSVGTEQDQDAVLLLIAPVHPVHEKALRPVVPRFGRELGKVTTRSETLTGPGSIERPSLWSLVPIVSASIFRIRVQSRPGISRRNWLASQGFCVLAARVEGSVPPPLELVSPSAARRTLRNAGSLLAASSAGAGSRQ